MMRSGPGPPSLQQCIMINSCLWLLVLPFSQRRQLSRGLLGFVWLLLAKRGLAVRPQMDISINGTQSISRNSTSAASMPQSPVDDILNTVLKMQNEGNEANTARLVEEAEKEVETFPKKRPFVTNMVLATLRCCLADLVTQCLQSRRDRIHASEQLSARIDWRRNFVFLIFGCLYDGVVSWTLEVVLLTWLFPKAARFANESGARKLEDRKGLQTLYLQVLLDNFVFLPFLYFPLFYILKAYAEGRSFRDAMKLFKSNFWEDARVAWLLWIPSDVVEYSVPMWSRMIVMQFVGFAWEVALSAMRGSAEWSQSSATRWQSEADRAGGG